MGVCVYVHAQCNCTLVSTFAFYWLLHFTLKLTWLSAGTVGICLTVQVIIIETWSKVDGVCGCVGPTVQFRFLVFKFLWSRFLINNRSIVLLWRFALLPFVTCASRPQLPGLSPSTQTHRHVCAYIFIYMYLKTAALQFFARSKESHSFSLWVGFDLSSSLSVFSSVSAQSLSLSSTSALSLSTMQRPCLIAYCWNDPIDHLALLSRNLGWATLNNAAHRR